MENKELLRAFADNQMLFDAIHMMVARHFNVHNLDETQSTMQLGEEVKARLIGLKAVDEAFHEIAQYRTTPPPPERINRAK